MKSLPNRREFLTACGMIGGALALGTTHAAEENAASIAISLDLEMARNFPNWEDTHWDYEKGNLSAAAKNYALEAARRVKKARGVIHFFLVAAALEQEDVGWLKEIVAMGHSIGSHTYDHVYLLAHTPEEIQFKFKRAPWLIGGRKVDEVIRDNLRLANAAMQSRLGIAPAGFRAPGGFADGLKGREDIQRMLLDLGFKWVSTKYPAHPNSVSPGSKPTEKIFSGIVEAQQAAQPFVYPTGLIEIPMAPISDVGAFRNGRWELDDFLHSTKLNVEWAIKNRAVFDFLSHPAVLSAKDPEFRVIDLICGLVKKAGPNAALVSLDTIAKRVKV